MHWMDGGEKTHLTRGESWGSEKGPASSYFVSLNLIFLSLKKTGIVQVLASGGTPFHLHPHSGP